MRHVIHMTQVDGDPGSAGTATTSEEEYGVTEGDESQVCLSSSFKDRHLLFMRNADLFVPSFHPSTSINNKISPL